MCRNLLDAGFVNESATVGRGLVERRLRSKDNKNYGDAVAMLVYMNSEEKFGKADIPQGRYMVWLQSEFPRHRKFWGMYDGTYVSPEERRNRWFRRCQDRPIRIGFSIGSGIHDAPSAGRDRGPSTVGGRTYTPSSLM